MPIPIPEPESLAAVWEIKSHIGSVFYSNHTSMHTFLFDSGDYFPKHRSMGKLLNGFYLVDAKGRT